VSEETETEEVPGAILPIPQAAPLAALRSEGAGEYRLILERDLSQEIFSEGWMPRAYARGRPRIG
jgi:hypothetical protein